mmetsp:Transcript_19065/g.27722  ORF Transcript_19065/g.27722 Transcript_19065/m.27722 type:complete len:95 (-) Transcript_19065:262-546(-)
MSYTTFGGTNCGFFFIFSGNGRQIRTTFRTKPKGLDGLKKFNIKSMVSVVEFFCQIVHQKQRPHYWVLSYLFICRFNKFRLREETRYYSSPSEC